MDTTTTPDTARCERCRRLRPLGSLRAAPDSRAYFCAPSDEGTDGATSATGAPCEPWVRPDTAALLAAWDAQPRGPFVVYSDEGPVWLPDGRKGPGRNAAGWSLSTCYPGTSPTDGSHRCIATALLHRENEPGEEALAALLASSRTDVPALCLAVDMLREELARVTRERDAYRRAKQENDERFMCERDEAREEARRLAVENDLLRAAMRTAWHKVADVANECEPGDLPDGGRLVPSDELLTSWGRACTEACAIFREMLEPEEAARRGRSAAVSP
jgi:hypothetical protein